MIFNFIVHEDQSVYEEVEPGKYEPMIRLSLVSMEDEERKLETNVSDSFRKFLGENLYIQEVLPLEYILRSCLFGKGLSDKDIDKGLKKIKSKWKKIRKDGEYSITV